MVKNQFWGWGFITIGSVFFLGFVYSAIFSKFLPSTSNPIISALQNDWYYCFLVPLTLPVLVVAVYFHWLSMKYSNTLDFSSIFEKICHFLDVNGKVHQPPKN